jgi:hypothetical protein
MLKLQAGNAKQFLPERKTLQYLKPQDELKFVFNG